MGSLIPIDVYEKLTTLVSDELAETLKAFLDEPKSDSAWWPLRLWLVDYSFERLRPGTSYYMEALASRQWLAFSLRYLSALLAGRERAYTADMVVNVIQNNVRVVDTLLFEDKAACIDILKQVYQMPLSDEGLPERPQPAVALRDEVQKQIGATRTVTIWTQKLIEQLAASILEDLSAESASTDTPYTPMENRSGLTYEARFDVLLQSARAGRSDYTMVRQIERRRADFIMKREQMRVTGQRLFRFTLFALPVIALLVLAGGQVAMLATYGLILILFGMYVLYVAFVSMMYYVVGTQLSDFEGEIGP
ncbi:MAG: hypothetical protein MUF38_17735 [Anaerolineae bacterium]|jgi:hypothetical protein|nr:hypothetical protein [Anaerolineae bacterium]